MYKVVSLFSNNRDFLQVCDSGLFIIHVLGIVHCLMYTMF